MKLSIRCAIIEDEPLACDLLKSYIEQTSFMKLIGTYNTAAAAIRNLAVTPVDMVFMDIKMPDVNGIALSRMLPIGIKTVFTSAYREYAVDAFRLGALDYLLKPLNYNEFLQSVNKAAADIERRSREEHHLMMPQPAPAAPVKEKRPDFVFVKTNYKTVRIDLDNLMFVEGQKDYVRFHLKSDPDNPIQSLASMKNLRGSLPHPDFLRIHRSFIIHTKFIDSIERGEVVISGTRIPISEGYKNELQTFVLKNSV